MLLDVPMLRKLFIWGNAALLVLFVVAVVKDLADPFLPNHWASAQRVYRKMQADAETNDDGPVETGPRQTVHPCRYEAGVGPLIQRGCHARQALGMSQHGAAWRYCAEDATHGPYAA